jgi:thioredoxin-related protein
MAAKPIVDGIEAEHGEALDVIRLNVQESAAQPLLQRFGFRFTPTFILFDAAGEELWRAVGAVDPVPIRELLNSD